LGRWPLCLPRAQTSVGGICRGDGGALPEAQSPARVEGGREHGGGQGEIARYSERCWYLGDYDADAKAERCRSDVEEDGLSYTPSDLLDPYPLESITVMSAHTNPTFMCALSQLHD
jgi:hypothetical protein